MKRYIKEKIKSIYTNRASKIRNNQLKKSFNIKLSNKELTDLKLYFGKELSNNQLICYEFYKSFGLFDPQLMPNDIYAEAERLLNPFRYSLCAQHKCLLKLFIPAESRPTTIIQNIDGHYFDSHDNPISKKQAIEIAKGYTPFMIKIAAGSGGGRGIKRVEMINDVEKTFDEYGRDFICQSVLKEHETLARFNPECINTIRVLSLNINDKCDILSSFVRMGGLGSIVDNLHSSKGTGVLVGLKQDGTFHSFGIDKNYNKVMQAPTGITFEGLKLEYYQEVKEFVQYWHQRSFPFANLIGWDIIINESGKPIVIEVNLDSADIAAHQIFNGPIFGDRTLEVLDYMKNNPQKIVIRL